MSMFSFEVCLDGTAVKPKDFDFQNGIFYAKYENQLHPRMDANELYNILSYAPLDPRRPGTSHIRSTGQPLQPEEKNYTASFYSAQLLHYGMRPMGEKSSAMDRFKLLAAFSGPEGKSLRVPWTIQNLEKTMREEWHESTPEGRAEKMKEVETPGAPLIGEQPFNRFSVALPSSSNTNLFQPYVLPGIRRVPTPPWIRKEKSIPKTKIRAMIENLKEDRLRARQVPFVRRDKPPARSNVFSKERLLLGPRNRAAFPPATGVDPPEWMGFYEIECPRMETGYGNRPNYSFEVYTSWESSHIWARFDFGILWGIMRSIKAPPEFFDDDIHFEWRGRDSRFNIMTFSPVNRAVIRFLPGGLLEGEVRDICFGTFAIYGAIEVLNCNFAKLTKRSVQEERHKVRSWKRQWRYINVYNSFLESRIRPGHYAGKVRYEQASESDTTDGEE